MAELLGRGENQGDRRNCPRGVGQHTVSSSLAARLGTVSSVPRFSQIFATTQFHAREISGLSTPPRGLAAISHRGNGGAARTGRKPRGQTELSARRRATHCFFELGCAPWDSFVSPQVFADLRDDEVPRS